MYYSQRIWAVAVLSGILLGSTTFAQQVFFSEDFESVELGPAVDEQIPADMPCDPLCWNPNGPDGWTVDRTNVPAGGVTEFSGWNFVDPVWWNTVAGQNRADFATGDQGFVIAVADGDEWDDLPTDPGIMDTTLSTPSIPVNGGSTMDLSFDSSWRAEPDQTAQLFASFDGGAPVEILSWSSDSAADNFKDDATFERIELPVTAPNGASDVSFHFNYKGGNNWWWAIDNIEFNGWEETFEDVDLGLNVSEGRAGGLSFDPDTVWSEDGPAGWTVDKEDVWGVDEPGIGVTEWKGWTFSNKDFWALVAEDQNRTFFEKGQGTVAVADPDEWDDLGGPGNVDAGQIFESFLTTPDISIDGAEENTLVLKFDSSWRPEDTQAANLTVSYDGGAATELLSWSSDAGSGDFHPDEENETVILELNNPAGASTVSISWGMLNASNDWWWAIDNIQVCSGECPGGVGVVVGDFDNNGVLDAADADLLAAAAASGANDAAFDLNGDSMVDADDVSNWAKDQFNTYLGDANLDGEFNSGDLVTLFAAGTYEAETAAVWTTGDFNGDGLFNTSDLVVALADGGYEQGPRMATAAVPEPSALALMLIGMLAFGRNRR